MSDKISELKINTVSYDTKVFTGGEQALNAR
jgi:hypothetical protein